MTHLLSRLCLPHLRTHLPCRLWTLKILGLSSDVSACAVPVRQASVLPWASFPRTPRDVAVALRLDLPSARRSTDLHARFYCSCSLSSRCALPGAPTKKALRDGRASGRRLTGTLLGLGGALELRSELLDAAGRVDEALLAGVGGMRVHRHVAENHEVVLAVDLLGAGGLHRGLGQEFLACSDVEEADVVEGGMDFGFHGKRGVDSALARLVARLDLVDDVDLALAAHDLAGRVTDLGGFDGGGDFL